MLTFSYHQRHNLVTVSLYFLSCYYPPLEEVVTLHFIIFEPPLPKDTLCQVWLKLVMWFLSRRFLKVVNVISLCGYYLPLEKCMALKFNKLEFSLPKNILCHVWLKLAQRIWRRFSKVGNYFRWRQHKQGKMFNTWVFLHPFYSIGHTLGI